MRVKENTAEPRLTELDFLRFLIFRNLSIRSTNDETIELPLKIKLSVNNSLSKSFKNCTSILNLEKGDSIVRVILRKSDIKGEDVFLVFLNCISKKVLT